MTDQIVDRLPQREMAPEYFYGHGQTEAILEALTDASLTAKAALADTADQLFVQSATWGLELWEHQVGIATDPTLSLTERRKAVLEKLTASGNTTADMVRSIAETLTGYQARVIMHQDYSFSLEFLGEQTELAPIDVSQVRAMVEQIKPAHLRFVITSLRWQDFEDLGMTWGWFDDHPVTWEQLEGEMFCVHGPSTQTGSSV